VRIGVNAPKHVSVYREELYREIKSANNDSRNASANSISVLPELIKDRKNDFRFANFDALTNKVKND
jgi:sRNA-binding carbon storage regulator CsrA